MKEFIDKLIERLEGRKEQVLPKERYLFENLGVVNVEGFNRGLKTAITIVNELAEEYKGGWIPYATGCKMPNEASRVWLSFTTPLASFVKSAWYINGHFEWDNCKRVKETPTAWKPYNIPAPYTEGE